MIGAGVTVKGDSIVATSAGVDFATSNQPSVKVGDTLVNLDATFGHENDLGDEVLGEGTTRSGDDVSPDDEVTITIDHEGVIGEEATGA